MEKSFKSQNTREIEEFESSLEKYLRQQKDLTQNQRLQETKD